MTDCTRTQRSPRLSALGLAVLCACASSASLLGTVAHAQSGPVATALPGGLQVVSGQVKTAVDGSQMTVTNSRNAILNWKDFSIGSQASVYFQQADSVSKVLNRVTGGNASQILGRLGSNGQVWLLNPNGIIFGQGARVDVAGLVATTLQTGNADFLRNSAVTLGGDSTASVINQGELRTTLGGHVALIGRDVRNEGTVTAHGGSVTLAAASSVDLVDTATPRLTVRVTQPAGQSLNLGALLSDDGRIDVHGATVNQDGVVRANRLHQDSDGRITLSASEDLSLGSGSQTLSQGTATAGGDITLEGRQIALLGQAAVDASGQAGGGRIRAGGGEKGQDTSLRNADAVWMSPAARLSADASQSGNGGRITLWGTQAARAYGRFSATGGVQGGNGGFVETSGGYLDARPAQMRLGAAAGRAGQWLLDPYTLTISDTVSDSGAGSAPNFTAGGDSTLSSATIQNALTAGSDVRIETACDATNSCGDIVFNGSTIFSSSTANLLVQSAGGLRFVQSALDLGGNAQFYSDGNISIGQSTLKSVGQLRVIAGLENGGGIQLQQGAKLISSNTLLAAEGLTNEAGAGALDSNGAGEWAVFLTKSGITSLGDLNQDYTQYGGWTFGFQPDGTPDYIKPLPGNGVFFGNSIESLTGQSAPSLNVAKLYDGSADITLSPTGSGVLRYETTGLLPGNTAAFSPAVGSFADASPGANKPLSVRYINSGVVDASGKPVLGYAPWVAAGSIQAANQTEYTGASERAGLAIQVDALRAVTVTPEATLPSKGRTLDAVQGLTSMDSTASYQALPLASMTAAQQETVLAARAAYKAEVFSTALNIISENPAAANLKACGNIHEMSSGNCLITEELKQKLQGVSQFPDAQMTELAKRWQDIGKKATRNATVKRIDRKIALVIGIGNYADQPLIPNLEGAPKDALAVSKILKNVGYQVVTLRDADRAGLIRNLNLLSLISKENDSVIIYFAGHGTKDKKGEEGFWIPADAKSDDPSTWVSNRDIAQATEEMSAKQILLIADSCFSGEFVGSDGVIRLDPSDDVPDDILDKKSALVMSSGGNEPVPDQGKNGHSPFTWNFMRQLAALSRWSTGASLFEKIREGVREDMRAESPQVLPRYGQSKWVTKELSGEYFFERREIDGDDDNQPSK